MRDYYTPLSAALWEYLEQFTEDDVQENHDRIMSEIVDVTYQLRGVIE